MFHRICSYVRHLLRWSIWKEQAKSFPSESVLSNAKPFRSVGNILVIAPHADDELIGCHQMISNHYNRVTILYCAFLGTNQSEDNRILREKEIRNYSSKQHCRLIISSPTSVKEDLRLYIKEQRPTIVFLPSVVDWHPEHRKVNYLLKEVLTALDYQCEIDWYHVSLPIPFQYVNCYSPMSKSQHYQKWQLMRRCYRSQLHMDLKRFRFVERLFESNEYAAETFISMNKVKWIYNLGIIDIKNDEEESLKNSLGNIYTMLKLTTDYYKIINRE